jgi:hypothetical protein
MIGEQSKLPASIPILQRTKVLRFLRIQQIFTSVQAIMLRSPPVQLDEIEGWSKTSAVVEQFQLFNGSEHLFLLQNLNTSPLFSHVLRGYYAGM